MRGEARAINDRGDAVGFFVDRGTRPVRWAAGGTAATELGVLGVGSGGLSEAMPVAINSRGDAVGTVKDYRTGNRAVDRAVIWSAGGTAAVVLPGLPGLGLETRSSSASDINDAGMIAGAVALYSGDQYVQSRPVLWNADGTVTDLGHGLINRINNVGDLIGIGPSGMGVAVWPAGEPGWVGLNSLIDPQGGWTLKEVVDINDGGVIVGTGDFDPDGAGPIRSRRASFRLTPVPEPGGVGAAAVMALWGRLLARGRRGRGQPGGSSRGPCAGRKGRRASGAP
jgi:hypothetical protein